MLAGALGLSVASLFLNPVGIRQVLYPLNLFFQQPVNVGNVEEWQPLDLTGARGLTFLAVLGCIALFVLLRRAQLHLHELALLVLGSWLAMNHRRMVFVFGILAAPIFSRLLADAWEQYDARRDRMLPNAVIMGAALLIAYAAFPSPANLQAQVERGSPVKAVDFINTHGLGSRMLNDYGFGGYLIWAAPEHPTFVDGRTDVFERTGVLREFGDWATLRSAPEALLDKYRVDFCLLAKGEPMTFVMPLLPGWTQVYSDDQAVIFARKGAAARGNGGQ